MRANEFLIEEAKNAKYNGLVMKYAFNDRALILKAFESGTRNPLAYVKFVKEDKELYPQDLWVNDDFRNKGIAKSMYDFLKNEGYIINRSHDQTKAGSGFWDKHRGEDSYVWEEDLTELFSPKGALPIEWESNMGAVYAYAFDHNRGKKIEIHFWQLPEGAVEIDFMVNESYRLTNKGDQFIVFATVVNAIKEYDERYAPKYLIFSAKEANRKSLYTQMVKRLAPAVGYTVGTIEDLPQEVHDNISLTPGDFVLIHDSAFVKEEINPDIRNPEFEHEQEIGDYLYTAKTVMSGSGMTTYLQIRCYDGAKLIGKVNFEVRNLVGKKWLESQQTEVAPEYKNQGVASTMYAYAKMLGNDIKPSPYQSDEGQDMWKAWKKSGAAKHLTTEEEVDEMALKQFTPMGDFNKPGPFKGVDKRLVPHPTNQIKTAQFFEKTPYDFRLFFSNIPGTGKYGETGPVTPEQLQQMFGEQAQPIIEGSEDAITVVFVGNSGDSKVMMTPWIMAHRFGHAIQAGVRRNRGWHTWAEAEKHFFNSVNSTLEEYYGKSSQRRGGMASQQTMQTDLTPEYNALFNAIGTQRSSRSGQIKRPYEFLYEIFAQYLGTGQVSFNPLPTNLGYGRQNWGNPSKYMNLKPEYRDEGDRAQATQTLANDMQYMFDDVLSSSVGQIFVM